jgi:hypothetical protein
MIQRISLSILMLGALPLLAREHRLGHAATAPESQVGTKTTNTAPAPADLPAQTLPVFGGTGGSTFSRSCGSGKVLTGLQYRASAVVDALALLCRPVGADGRLGTQSAVGSYVGGTGGTQGVAACPSGRVVAVASIRHGWFVDRITLGCRKWDFNTRRWLTDAQGGVEIVTIGGIGGTDNISECESTRQPVRSIRGRAASFVDAIGFTCDEP